MPPAPDEDISEFLIACGLARGGVPGRWIPLSGGVSSDIWRVDLPGRTVCVKRALARLRVTAEWRAPVERNATEWAWFETVAGICPDAVPKLVAHDSKRGLFAMEFLPPDIYPLWKTRLLTGEVDVPFAASVGRALGRIHAATAGDARIAERFATDPAFHALRIEPYILAVAERHPDLRARLHMIADRTAATRRALVHGDVSPKNILMGPKGPVFLDAETAWYGDPAFDLAFCLNHLVLKAMVQPDATDALASSFRELSESYFAQAAGEPRAQIEASTSSLLPVLMLARVDGKSPVEYLDTTGQSVVRAFARAQLQRQTLPLDTFYTDWRRAIGEVR